jgi:hypothetical protein
VSGKITYREFLLDRSASAIGALAASIEQAMRMSHEYEAVRPLEHGHDVARTLLRDAHPNPERVEARPERPANG